MSQVLSMPRRSKLLWMKLYITLQFWVRYQCRPKV